MKIKFSGYIDTDDLRIVIEKVKLANPRGAPKTPASRLAALIMAEAWARTNFSKQILGKADRISRALPKGYADEGSQRRAVRDAKKREADLFASPHAPGILVYGKVGAVWFSDRATHYPDLIVGFAWVWVPGKDEAVFTIAKAEPEGNLEK